MADGELHHIAVTRDNLGTVAFYVDGAVDTTHLNTPNPASASDQALQIGFSLQNAGPPPPLASNFFEGEIDEVTLWNRALDASEIEAVMQKLLPADTTGLLGNWRLDEGLGQAAADSSGPPILNAVLGNELVVEPSDPVWICEGCRLAPSGLVAWWPGDSVVADLVASNDVVAQGGATFAPAQVGHGFRNVSAGDAYHAQDSPLWHNDQFTVDAWVNATEATGGGANDEIGGIVAVKVLTDFPHVPPYVSWILTYQPQVGRFWTNVQSGVVIGSFAEGLASNTDFAAGDFHHVAIAFDGANLRLYVNGALQGEKTGLGAITYTDKRLGIGGHAFGNYPFDRTLIGTIDEVDIFDRALSDVEIAALAASRDSGKCKNDGVGVHPGPASQPLPLTLAYPNPFRGQLGFRFSLPTPQFVSIDVFDPSGRWVRSLDSGRKEAGHHVAIWNGEDAGGGPTAAGIYFIRLRYGAHLADTKVVLLR